MTCNVNPKINIFFVTHPFAPPNGGDLNEFIFGFTKASSSLNHETKENLRRLFLYHIVKN
jgi:hypothetical protein